MKITPHIVVPDAAEAAALYVRALGAQELSRIPLPGDRVMTVELRIGESTVNVGSEFPEVSHELADPFRGEPPGPYMLFANRSGPDGAVPSRAVQTSVELD